MQPVDMSRPSWREAARTALIYLVFSLFWIYIGDRLLLALIDDPKFLTYWQTAKGVLFVLFSTALIYLLISRGLTSLRHEQAQAQHLAQMTRHSPAVSICWKNTPGWPVTFVSDNIDQWGYNANAFCSGTLNYDQLIHPDDLPRIRSEVAKHLLHGPDTYQQQYRVRHGDGRWVWLEDRTWLLRDKQGRVTDIYGVLIDISEEKQLHEQLRTSEAHYRMLFEANPHPMWVFDLDTLAFLAVNDAAITKYGYTRDEFLNMTIRDIRPPEDIDRLEDNIEKVTKGLDRAGIWQHMTKDGNKLAVEITSHTLTFEGRRAEVVLAHDVTERLHAELALLGRNAALEQFHYTISHDLRTPLVTIESFLGFLEQDLIGADPSLIANDVAHIRTATRRMERLLDDLGKLLLSKNSEVAVTIDYNTLIEETCRLVAGPIKKQGVKMINHPSLLSLYGNRNHLLQVWQNLVENAIKYMGDQTQPTIEIGVKKTSEPVIFYVRDNGIGIDKKNQNKIFGLFDQLNNSSPGSGLGLALVNRLVELYDGRVWVESEGTGQGSCFCFTLPAAIKHQESA